LQKALRDRDVPLIVVGKEAVQVVARDILLKETPDYLKSVVLLICPGFNSDGNET
jgi:hypothetical protein